MNDSFTVEITNEEGVALFRTLLLADNIGLIDPITYEILKGFAIKLQEVVRAK